VIILVTGGALIGNRPVKYCFTGSAGKALDFLEVTFLTGSGAVFSLQRIVRILLVVEVQELPLKPRGNMAELTFLIELAQVNVLMATAAIDFQGFIDDGFFLPPGIVTLVTGYGAVFPGKGIPPGIVVI
jgi:hypothetical protein